MLHFNIPWFISHIFLDIRLDNAKQSLSWLTVYRSKICALFPLDCTVRWISLARRFGKVISILTGTFIPPPGPHLALASLTGLTLLPKWTNLLSSSEHRTARQLQQIKGTRDNFNFNTLDIQNNLTHANRVICAKDPAKVTRHVRGHEWN